MRHQILRTSSRSIIVRLFATVAFAVAIALAQAGSAGVQDNSGFFSPKAKAEANGNIRDPQKTLGKDVCVETFAELPSNVRQDVNAQDRTAMNRLSDQWAVQRAREQRINGVYILPVKQPTGRGRK